MSNDGKMSFADMNRRNNLLPKEERYPKTGDISDGRLYECLNCDYGEHVLLGELLPECPNCGKTFYMPI